jgi:hypothetical protein
MADGAYLNHFPDPKSPPHPQADTVRNLFEEFTLSRKRSLDIDYANVFLKPDTP